MVISSKEILGKSVKLLIILTLCTSCKNQVDDIDGLWIGTDVIYNDSLKESVAVNPLIYLQSETLYFRTVGYINGIHDNVDSLTTTYELKNGKLYLNKIEKEIILDKLTNDSVIACYDDNKKTKMVFQRIEQNNSVELNNGFLLQKEFSYVGDDGSVNSLFFVNDSSIVSLNMEENIPKRMKWELVGFKSQMFFLLEDEIGSMTMHLDSIEADTIYLSKYSGSKSYRFKKQPESMPETLLGDWYFHSNPDSISKPFYDNRRIQNIESIHFNKNHVQYEVNGSTVQKDYVLSGLGQLVVMSDRVEAYSDIWKIDKLEGDEMTLTQYSDKGGLKQKTSYKKLNK